MLTKVALPTLLLALSVASCGKPDPAAPDSGADVGFDAAPAPDSGELDFAMDAPDEAADMPASGGLCASCTADDDCGGTEDLCITATGDERFCGRACGDALPCPADYFCALLDEAAGIQQCVPDNLTCIDRCADAACDAGEICDPLSGECRRPLRLCETGCTIDAVCGDGPEDLCLNVPGTPDGERACFTGCNPQAETPACPPDFFCGSLDPDNAPERGVCFPFEGTCVDRCATVDCPAGENCDPVTGGCSAAQYGACEPGCANNAQCGGQDDLCLNLGIGDGAHCWQDCTNTGCPGGYDCRSLIGTTIRVCIPLGNDCSTCYAQACFPDGVCNPVDGGCEPLPRVCSSDRDCSPTELCDPTSATCVEIGRPCNGSTWAVDCDNTVTRCTSQRAGVAGTCAQICQVDADCVSGTCQATNLGNFCLADPLGGPTTCGTLHPAGSTVGRPCNPGGCFASAPICVDDAGPGFCSRTCTSDAMCDAGQSCILSPGQGQRTCVASNCGCAGAAGVGAAGEAALAGALTTLGLAPCDITFESGRFLAIPSARDLPGERAAFTHRIATPFATIGWAQDIATQLDGAVNVAGAVQQAAAAAGLSVTPTARNFTYPGPQGALAQAIAELVAAAGQTPDLAALDVAVASVPANVQAAAAPVVSATALMISARRNLLGATFGGGGDAQRVFDKAPWLFLPANAAQAAGALDFDDPAATALIGAAADYADDLVAAADFVGQLPGAIAALQALGAPTFPTVSIPTPAGRVVVAGGGDDTHDVATHGTEIAVLIDLGGDDSYTVAVGANASLGNGVSVAIDLGGSDEYGYVEVADPNDGVLLPSDAAGRIAPTLPLNQANGPVSASDVARQGSGRLGVGLLVDVGAGTDVYRSLRMSQGAAVFGLGVLYDDGPATFAAEALAQGGAIGGLGVMWAHGTHPNDYRVWHAGQGFGTFGGAGVAFDAGGDDSWTAVPGVPGDVLYLSAADRGVSNRNLAQGASVGADSVHAGGLGVLRDAGGADVYTAGTYAQAYARATALAALIDASGDDVWNGRGLVQGVGELRGGAALVEAAGDDLYNQATPLRVVGQGAGRTVGWGAFVDLGGADVVQYLPSGGGVGLDGGLGLALHVDGTDTHTVGSDASWGFAQISALPGEPGAGAPTIGIFLDTGGMTDAYTRPSTNGITDNGVWSTLTTSPIFAFGADN